MSTCQLTNTKDIAGQSARPFHELALHIVLAKKMSVANSSTLDLFSFYSSPSGKQMNSKLGLRQKIFGMDI